MFLELIEVMAYKEYSDIRLEDLCPSHTIVAKRTASEKSLSDSSVSIMLKNGDLILCSPAKARIQTITHSPASPVECPNLGTLGAWIRETTSVGRVLFAQFRVFVLNGNHTHAVQAIFKA